MAESSEKEPGTKCNEILSKSELKITRMQANFAEQMNLVEDPEEINGDEVEDA